MTASTPSRDSSIDSRPAGPEEDRTAPRNTPSGPLERARAAARKLLGRDRDKPKKDDPNIYPLF
jgi:hypothetical protein